MQLLRLFGIRIGVDASWFVVLFLAIYVLQDSFRGTVSGGDTAAYVAAVLVAFTFFGSIVLHELGHALAARREGIGVSGIDLFFFGGLMKMTRDPDTPGAEFRVAAAGPLVTLLLILLGAGAGMAVEGWNGLWDTVLLQGPGGASIGVLVLGWGIVLNAMLLAFNLVPAYPLDGGRIARAAIWKLTGDRSRATRVTAAMGRGFGWLLIAVGIGWAFSGSPFDGLWLAVLGWLLSQSARGVVAQTAFTDRLEGVTVADIMDHEPVVIPGETPAHRAFEEFFLRYGYDWFPVVDPEGRYVGRARRTPIETVAAGAEGERPVRDFIPPDDDGAVSHDSPLETLVASEPLRRLGALTAVDETGRLRGVVTVDQVTRALRARLAPQS
jgi:Zn-dependent protease